ncbi:MAG: sensor histidine kinase [Oscillospiraceae bacterium]|jgi:signal transduction histidine kinase
MSFGEFLSDRLPTVVLTMLAAVFGFVLLVALGAGSYAGSYLAGVIILSQALAFVMEYLPRRRFYRELGRDMDLLDKKYLISEVMPEAGFAEGRILAALTREADKSMCDEVARHERTSKEYREYIESWVHEIKTPISAARLMLENEPRERAKPLSHELTSIENYVEQALYYSRSGSVEKDYRIRETTLQELVASALKKNAELLIGAGAAIHTEGLDKTVFTDAKWTDFMLSQVLTNCVKYSRGPLEIRVTGETLENAVALTIADNGIGVPAADVPHVFDKGFTGENGRGGARSTGLGLYLCKMLCDKMGLGVSLRSEAGAGTQVRFVFPADLSRQGKWQLYHCTSSNNTM